MKVFRENLGVIFLLGVLAFSFTSYNQQVMKGKVIDVRPGVFQFAGGPPGSASMVHKAVDVFLEGEEHGFTVRDGALEELAISKGDEVILTNYFIRFDGDPRWSVEKVEK